LQPVEDFLGHIVPPFGWRDGATTREHEERHICVIPKKRTILFATRPEGWTLGGESRDQLQA
jgi:hypothetical protein